MANKDTIDYAKFVQFVSAGIPYRGNIKQIGPVTQYKDTWTLLKQEQKGFWNNVWTEPNFFFSPTFNIYGCSADFVQECLKKANPQNIIDPFRNRQANDAISLMGGFRNISRVCNTVAVAFVMKDIHNNLSQTDNMNHIFGVDINIATDVVFFAMGFIPGVGWVITATYIVTSLYLREQYNKGVGEYVTDKAMEAMLPAYIEFYEKLNRWLTAMVTRRYM